VYFLAPPANPSQSKRVECIHQPGIGKLCAEKSQSSAVQIHLCRTGVCRWPGLRFSHSGLPKRFPGRYCGSRQLGPNSSTQNYRPTGERGLLDYGDCHCPAEELAPTSVCKPKPKPTQLENLCRFLLENEETVDSAFGTHNVRSIANVLAQAERLGMDRKRFEFQML